MSWVGPFENIARKANNSFAKRVITSSFWQKLIDTFQLLSGTLPFSFREPDAGEALPIYFEYTSPHRWRAHTLGLIDFSPLILLRVLSFFSWLIYDDAPRLGSGIIADIVRFTFMGTGLGLFYLFTSIQFILAVALTLVSLPFISFVHLISKLIETSIINENVAAQKRHPNQPEEIQSTIAKDIKYKQINSYDAMRKFLLAETGTLSVVTPDIEQIDEPNKIILFEKKIPQAQPAGLPQQYNYEYYFLRFSYTRAGYTAFNTLLNKLRDLKTPGIDGETSCHLAQATGELTERDRKVGEMIHTFFVMAQMSRNPEQQLNTRQPQEPHFFYYQNLSTISFTVTTDMAKEIAARRMDHAYGLSLANRHAILDAADQELNFSYKVGS